MGDIRDTLLERGLRYGLFENHAKYAEGLIQVFERSPQWGEMKPDAKQALRTIADKIARILNGLPDYDDNWRDIAGYATLVLDRIERELEKAAADVAITLPDGTVRGDMGGLT